LNTNTQTKKTVFVAGHNGMVGSAICRNLETRQDVTLVTHSRKELDLLDRAAVQEFFSSSSIDEVYLAAAKVGGIHANSTYPAEFIYENLQIQNNIIHSSHENDMQKLLFLGSSCIYPRMATQPMKESVLLTGLLEPTNEPYAVAKIAGIKMCESYNRQYGRDYRSVMPTNLYGLGDNFHPENSHVIPGLMRRFRDVIKNGTSEVVIWGTGKPKREFLHVDDMAAASIHVNEMSTETHRALICEQMSHLNVGTGIDSSIAEIAELLKEVTGFRGSLSFDSSKPDGAPRKLLDVSAVTSSGWSPKIELKTGLQETWDWFNQYVS